MSLLDTTTFLFRKALSEEKEYEHFCEAFGNRVVEFRSQIPANSMVIGRYSVLPYYGELERELATKGSILINSYSAHEYIASMNYVYDLQGLTPRTWDTWGNLPEGSYVVKGRTNSRKFMWDTHMFAPTRADVPIVAARLMEDTMVRDQGLVVREYIPLVKIGEGINGLPHTNEWRIFILDGKVVAYGFYWSIAERADEFEGMVPHEGIKLALQAFERLAMGDVRFCAIDVAQKLDGGWIVIEVNDGQMSGLSTIPHEMFISGLRSALSG